MNLLRIGAPSIHTSLKLILADKKKNQRLFISYNVISATKYVPPDPKSYSLPQSIISCPRSHAQETELQS